MDLGQVVEVKDAGRELATPNINATISKRSRLKFELDQNWKLFDRCVKLHDRSSPNASLKITWSMQSQS